MMDNVQALLWMCVKEWDRMNQDGAHPRDTLERVCARTGLDVKILVDDEACTMSSLEQHISEGAAPSQFGAAITGIPRQGGQVCDTFLLLRFSPAFVRGSGGDSDRREPDSHGYGQVDLQSSP